MSEPFLEIDQNALTGENGGVGRQMSDEIKHSPTNNNSSGSRRGASVVGGERRKRTINPEMVGSSGRGSAAPKGSMKVVGAITGRAGAVPLSERVNMAFMTTYINSGRGRGVVVATGAHTEIGRVSYAISNAVQVDTPLQLQQSQLARALALIAFFAGMVVMLVGVIRAKRSVEIIEESVTLAVSVIPEGLYPVITLAMFFGIRRMRRYQTSVRRLAAAETLGAVTTVCADKVSILTTGITGNGTGGGGYRAGVDVYKTEQFWSDGCVMTFSGSHLVPDEGQALGSDGEAILKVSSPLGWSLMVASLCNTANLSKDSSNAWKLEGEPDEIALAVSALKTHFTRSFFEEEIGMDLTGVFPYDADRQRMSVLYALRDGTIQEGLLFDLDILSSQRNILLVKGATDTLIPRCTTHIARVCILYYWCMVDWIQAAPMAVAAPSDD